MRGIHIKMKRLIKKNNSETNKNNKKLKFYKGHLIKNKEVENANL